MKLRWLFNIIAGSSLIGIFLSVLVAAFAFVAGIWEKINMGQEYYAYKMAATILLISAIIFFICLFIDKFFNKD